MSIETWGDSGSWLGIAATGAVYSQEHSDLGKQVRVEEGPYGATVGFAVGGTKGNSGVCFIEKRDAVEIAKAILRRFGETPER